VVETEEGIKRKIEIKLDLTFENSDLLGCNTFHMGYKSTEFIQKMLVEYPSLYTVTMIFKEFLDKRGLLNAYQGGISSYCLILMILATFVKFGDNGYDLATRRFLKFYGEEFYPEKTGITLMQQDPFFSL